MSEKNSFPTIVNLPVHVVAANWKWSRPKPKPNLAFGLKPDWWIGTDEAGRRWVVKMSGSDCAYREHVFAALAQRLDISCQSSMYLTIPRNAAPMIHEPKTESHQLALWFLDEHETPCSSQKCPMTILQNLSINSEATLQTYLSCGVSRAVDWIRGAVIGYLCGQYEPAGHLFTVEHEFVQIDNEFMFHSGPVNLESCQWLRYNTGRQCAEEICSGFSKIPDEELLSFAEIPKGYVVSRKNNVRRRLIAAKRAADNFLAKLIKRKTATRLQP